jgi:hypothetical protein
MIAYVRSRGQTGADVGGWRAAKAAGIPTGGAMPKGFLTEDGPRPEYAEMYGAHELATEDYAARTKANAEAAHSTIWFGETSSNGAIATLGACSRLRMPSLIIPLQGTPTRPSDVVAWLQQHNIKDLNVAGNRESEAPGIGARVEVFLGRVFKLLAASQNAQDSS